MDLEEFQSGIGYQFENEDLLVQSLTHPSYMAEANPYETNNQRLEFLGDSALSLIITEYLYQTFPEIREGQLTQYRATLVKGSLLAIMARKLKLSRYMRVSPNETGESTKDLPSSREDAFEALIGAIYLDSDFPTTREVVLGWYGDIQSKLTQLNLEHNPKGQLQERMHSQLGDYGIHYQVTSERGPPHDRTFEVELSIRGKSMGKGTGKSKKEAEERAARQTLDQFESLVFPDA